MRIIFLGVIVGWIQTGVWFEQAKLSSWTQWRIF